MPCLVRDVIDLHHGPRRRPAAGRRRVGHGLAGVRSRPRLSVVSGGMRCMLGILLDRRRLLPASSALRPAAPGRTLSDRQPCSPRRGEDDSGQAQTGRQAGTRSETPSWSRSRRAAETTWVATGRRLRMRRVRGKDEGLITTPISGVASNPPSRETVVHPEPGRRTHRGPPRGPARDLAPPASRAPAPARRRRAGTSGPASVTIDSRTSPTAITSGAATRNRSRPIVVRQPPNRAART